MAAGKQGGAGSSAQPPPPGQGTPSQSQHPACASCAATPPGQATSSQLTMSNVRFSSSGESVCPSAGSARPKGTKSETGRWCLPWRACRGCCVSSPASAMLASMLLLLLLLLALLLAFLLALPLGPLPFLSPALLGGLLLLLLGPLLGGESGRDGPPGPNTAAAELVGVRWRGTLACSGCRTRNRPICLAQDPVCNRLAGPRTHMGGALPNKLASHRSKQ